MIRVLSTLTVLLLLVFTGVTAGCSARGEANRRAERERVDTIVCDAPFDEAAARAALEPGSATIDGVAFTRVKKNPIHVFFVPTEFAENTGVVLLPATPYVEAWHTLREKEEDRNTRVLLSDEAWAVKRETTTDAYGRFRFDDLKPGRYFLQCFLDWTQTGTRRVAVGSVRDGYGGAATIYENQGWSEDRTRRLSRFVDVDGDEAVVEVDLKG